MKVNSKLSLPCAVILAVCIVNFISERSVSVATRPETFQQRNLSAQIKKVLILGGSVKRGRKVANLVFSPDGRTLATNYEYGGDKVFLWDIATGQVKMTLSEHRDTVTSLDFSPDGQTLLTGSSDGTAKLWNMATGQARATLNVGLDGSPDFVKAIFSPDGRTVATSGSTRPKLWDAATGQLKITLAKHPEAVYAMAFGLGGQVLATESYEGQVRPYAVGTGNAMLWSVATGQLKTKFVDPKLIYSGSHETTIYNLTFSPDGRTMATASRDKTAKLWDAETGQWKATLSGYDGGVNPLAFSPDSGTLVAAGGYKHYVAKLWDVKTGQLKATLDGHKDEIWYVAFNPDGRTVVTASNRVVKLWDAATGKLRATLNDARAPLAFSLDGQMLATAGSNNNIILWIL